VITDEVHGRMPIVPAREGGNVVVPRPARSLHEKPPRKRRFSHAEGAHALFLEPDARELLLEPREPPAAIHQLLLTAGPGRMRLGVNVEVHGVAFLAPGTARVVNSVPSVITTLMV